MLFQVSQRFYFESAHTLSRQIDAADDVAGSRRVHGHTYQAEVAVSGQPDPASGMVVDLSVLRRHIGVLRQSLDHHLLDDVPGLGAPTLENLCSYIARHLAAGRLPVSHVRVWREASGDACLLTLADAGRSLQAGSAVAHPVEDQVDERRTDDPQRKQG